MIKQYKENSRSMDDIAYKVAIGATGVALIAGAIAAGAAAISGETRNSLQKGAEKTAKGLKRMSEVVHQGQQGYQAIQHRVASIKGKKNKSKRSSSAT